MGGSSGGQTVDNDPWSGQQPYLTDIMRNSQGLYQGGVGQQYYPGQTVAPFSDPTMMGFDALMSRAGGTPGQDMMGSYLGQQMGMSATPMLAHTAAGGFLPGQNPYLDDVFDRSARQVTDRFNEELLPGLNATFGGAGRTGSGIHAQLGADLAGDARTALGDLSAGIYGGAYETERDRMLRAGESLQEGGARAAALFPTYDGLQRQNVMDMMNVGGALEDQTQRLMNADRQQFDFYQQAPWQALGNYANMVYGLPGGYGTQTTDPGGGSRLAGGIGGAMAGAGLAGSVGALNPYMMPLAIGGGLMGIL